MELCKYTQWLKESDDVWKKRKSIVLLVVIASVMALPMIGKVQLSPQIVIEINPQATTVEVGDFFNVSVYISDANDIDAFQFVLMYDPNILSAIEVWTSAETGPHGYCLDGELTGVPTVWNGYDCDIVPDGVLDIYDFIAWRDAYASSPGDPNWNPRADINNSGGVGLDDFFIWRDAWWDTYVDSPGTIWFNWVPSGAWAGGLFANVTFEAIHCCCCGNTPLDLDDVKLSFMGAPVPYQIIDGTVMVTMPPNPPVDVNGDHIVDILDINYIIAYWGGYDASADVNNDGVVDIFDIAEVGTHWGCVW